MLSHYRFHKRGNPLQHAKCFVGIGTILEVSKGFDESLRHILSRDKVLVCYVGCSSVVRYAETRGAVVFERKKGTAKGNFGRTRSRLEMNAPASKYASRSLQTRQSTHQKAPGLLT